MEADRPIECLNTTESASTQNHGPARASATVRGQPRIVATMTTIPSRIGLIRPVIDAVLAQTVPIQHIELNVPYDCMRTGEAYNMVLTMYFSARRMPIYLYNRPSDETPYMLSGWLPHASDRDALVNNGHKENYKRAFAFINSLGLASNPSEGMPSMANGMKST